MTPSNELRALEQKRVTSGLSPQEEARRASLASASRPAGGGFDVSAAAADVRSSLADAPAPAAPVSYGPEDYGLDPSDPEAVAWASWYASQGWDPATAYAWAQRQAAGEPAAAEAALAAEAPVEPEATAEPSGTEEQVGLELAAPHEFMDAVVTPSAPAVPDAFTAGPSRAELTAPDDLLGLDAFGAEPAATTPAAAVADLGDLELDPAHPALEAELPPAAPGEPEPLAGPSPMELAAPYAFMEAGPAPAPPAAEAPALDLDLDLSFEPVSAFAGGPVEPAAPLPPAAPVHAFAAPADPEPAAVASAPEDLDVSIDAAEVQALHLQPLPAGAELGAEEPPAAVASLAPLELAPLPPGAHLAEDAPDLSGPAPAGAAELGEADLPELSQDAVEPVGLDELAAPAMPTPGPRVTFAELDLDDRAVPAESAARWENTPEPVAVDRTGPDLAWSSPPADAWSSPASVAVPELPGEAPRPEGDTHLWSLGPEAPAESPVAAAPAAPPPAPDLLVDLDLEDRGSFAPPAPPPPPAALELPPLDLQELDAPPPAPPPPAAPAAVESPPESGALDWVTAHAVPAEEHAVDFATFDAAPTFQEEEPPLEPTQTSAWDLRMGPGPAAPVAAPPIAAPLPVPPPPAAPLPGPEDAAEMLEISDDDIVEVVDEAPSVAPAAPASAPPAPIAAAAAVEFEELALDGAHAGPPEGGLGDLRDPDAGVALERTLSLDPEHPIDPTLSLETELPGSIPERPPAADAFAARGGAHDEVPLDSIDWSAIAPAAPAAPAGPPAAPPAPPSIGLDLAAPHEFLDAVAAAPDGAVALDGLSLSEPEPPVTPHGFEPTLRFGLDKTPLDTPAPAEEVTLPPAAPPQSEVPTAAHAPIPAPAAAPVADASLRVPGAHRVVIHTTDGQVKRGLVTDLALDGPVVLLAANPGAAPAPLPAEQVKAIFFMLPTGAQPSPADGKRVRVTFRDGRQVAGFSADYDPERIGFFMVPVDTRTHTARIWVYRSSVRQVSVT